MKIYTVYDRFAKESGMLFEAKNDIMANRIFNGVQEWPVGTSKEDFILVCLGDYDHGDTDRLPAIVPETMRQVLDMHPAMLDEEVTVNGKPA